ncbi:MAG: hypothetical protein U0324_35330 [Polyangiales bacterium]
MNRPVFSMLATASALAACASPNARATLNVPDVHAHDRPVSLSQRVAIDEEPCEGVALAPVGVLDGATEGYTTGPARALQGTIVGAPDATAADLQGAAVRGGSLRVLLGRVAQRQADPMMERPRGSAAPGEPDPCDHAARVYQLGPFGPTATDQYIPLGEGESGLGAVRCFVPVNERRYRSDVVVEGDAVRVTPEAIAARCRAGGRP